MFNDANHHIKKEAKYKIVSYIDSLSCTSCYFSHYYSSWANLSGNFKDKDFSFYLIFYTNDIDGIKRLFDLYKLDIPFFIDFYDDFKTNNNIPVESVLHTFLLKDNTVILAGDPFNNSKLFELYKQEIYKN